MTGLNLHHVVRGVITSVHPDEECILFQAVGQVNVKGVITPEYSDGAAVRVNVQPLDAQALRHLERMDDAKATMQAFLYSDMSFPISGIKRMPLRGGDFVKRQDGTWWMITSVLEDWSWDGWANVGIVEQITPPDFSISSVEAGNV